MTDTARYRLYGLTLRSTAALAAPREDDAGPADVSLVRATAKRFADARRGAIGRWFAYRRTRRGDSYLRWKGLVECLVSRDGRGIEYRPLLQASDEAMMDYVLGTLLSFSLVARGLEPLHATTVLVDGRAVAFLGDCGTGKSTIAAALLARGYPLLTDDLLSLTNGRGRYIAHPGPARIKLYPHVARALLGRGDGTPMSVGTTKRVLALAPGQARRRAARLGALYSLETAPRGSVARVEPLTRAEALIEIVRGAFNVLRTDPARLAQQFAFASALADAMPVSRLVVPRSLSALPAVGDAVLRDLRACPSP